MLTKDDKAHGSMLIMNELIRSASIEGEVCELKYLVLLYTLYLLYSFTADCLSKLVFLNSQRILIPLI